MGLLGNIFEINSGVCWPTQKRILIDFLMIHEYNIFFESNVSSLMLQFVLLVTYSSH